MWCVTLFPNFPFYLQALHLTNTWPIEREANIHKSWKDIDKMKKSLQKNNTNRMGYDIYPALCHKNDVKNF